MPIPQTLSSQQAGRSAYASGDFAAALSHFTSALSQPNIPLSLRVQILDHLSATREKLQDLPGALADARCIMRLRPTAVEGYLRGGKILQLLGRQDDALRLYLYGLDKLPAGGDGGRVRAQVDKLRARIAGKKCEEERGRRRDLFEILPIEVAVLVLAHLPFRTLMLARAVSKGWKGVIEAAPRTFSEVDFTEARRGVTPAAFKAIVNASRGGVRIARISKLAGGGGKTTSGLLGYLVRRARRLMTLEVYRSGEVDTALVEVVREGVRKGLRELVLDVQLDLGVVFKLLLMGGGGDGLEVACFDNVHLGVRESEIRRLTESATPCESLKILRIDVVERGVYLAVPLSTLTKPFPNLKSLQLPGTSIFQEDEHLDFTALPSLQTLEYSQPGRPRYPLLPTPTLSHLTIIETFATYTPTDITSSSPLPLLQSLFFDTSPSLTTETLTAILTPNNNIRLTTLKLEMCPRLDFPATFEFLRESGVAEGLVGFSLKGNGGFGDEHSVEFGAFRRLERVDVGFTGVSGVGVLNILGRAGKGRKDEGDEGEGKGVEWIGIEGCGCVGVDAVERVRGMGVKVFRGNGRGGGEGGRKVRYE